MYATEGDNRGTAPKSYVHLLQARINVLEQVLRLHSIDADESIAQLMAMNALPVTDASAAAGASSSTFDQLCTDFEGALCFDESSNFDRDGEARYFGTTSGRLEFQSPQSKLRSLLYLYDHNGGETDAHVQLSRARITRRWLKTPNA